MAKSDNKIVSALGIVAALVFGGVYLFFEFSAIADRKAETQRSKKLYASIENGQSQEQVLDLMGEPIRRAETPRFRDRGPLQERLERGTACTSHSRTYRAH